MKYGTWNISNYNQEKAQILCQNGFSPLTAAVLCSRGCESPAEARQFLDADAPLMDPLQMKEMDNAAERVRLALRRGEQMAVFGDYDVDGITATCLLTEFLRSQGGHVLHYIPGRIEEGYGLNKPAIEMLHSKGVRLLITVDCGITANEEALFCRELGMDLIITDHHECKDVLPDATAVVDPHRKDRTYPHTELAGVGVAFKLAAAIVGNQQIVLERYSDLLCLGTVADVMPLTGENRTFVAHGLHALEHDPRPGIAALMAECSCDQKAVTANTIGYTLAPRINAAGRMGRVELATELFLTTDPVRARVLARELCVLNRQRQEIEAEIYREAVGMLPSSGTPNAIVLAGETWHQGVVGIVASRLAEEYACPTYLICLDGEHGKASSRSYGGFNLFSSLETLSHLLESYGGHELAAGFTINRSCIDEFRREILRLADAFAESGQRRAALEIDCPVEPQLLTEQNVTALDQLEPCGSGCPKPVFFMDRVTVEHLSEVGSGKHLRLRLSRDKQFFGAIFFSTNALRCGIAVGDRVEIAFTPQINEFRGMRTVQLNMVDIRPDQESRLCCDNERAVYERYCSGSLLSAREIGQLLPVRQDFTSVWRYLTAHADRQQLVDELDCLSRKITRHAGMPCYPGRLRVCLDVFQERGLLHFTYVRGQVTIQLSQPAAKVDLTKSPILLRLNQQKAGE